MTPLVGNAPPPRFHPPRLGARGEGLHGPFTSYRVALQDSVSLSQIHKQNRLSFNMLTMCSG